jgi:hypothetical protein
MYQNDPKHRENAVILRINASAVAVKWPLRCILPAQGIGGVQATAGCLAATARSDGAGAKAEPRKARFFAAQTQKMRPNQQKTVSE